MRRAKAFLILTGILVLATVLPASADEPARVTKVTPARAGHLVVAHLTIDGLPGEKLLQSMRSGLVSSVDLDLALLDDRQEVVAGNRLSLKLAFDLWEEIFSVRSDSGERRFQSLDDLSVYLAELGPVPVAPASLLDPEGRYRLRVDLQVHPIAPAERERVEDVIVGDQRPRREGQDQQEASVSLGNLIRFFYKGGEGNPGGQEFLSVWFVGKELPHEKD